METKYLVMTFKNEKGDNVNLSLKGIKENLTSAEMWRTMDTIVAKNAFFSSGGNLVQKVGAQVVTKNIDEYKVG